MRPLLRFAALALLTACGGSPIEPRRPATPRVPATPEVVDQSRLPPNAIVDVSPDGALVAIARGNVVLIHRLRDDRTVKRLTFDHAISQLWWDATGDRLAMQGAGALRVFDTTTNRAVGPWTLPCGQHGKCHPEELLFNLHATRMAWRTGRTITVLELASGHTNEVIVDDNDSDFGLSADGLTITSPTTGFVDILRVDGGDRTRVPIFDDCAMVQQTSDDSALVYTKCDDGKLRVSPVDLSAPFTSSTRHGPRATVDVDHEGGLTIHDGHVLHTWSPPWKDGPHRIATDVVHFFRSNQNQLLAVMHTGDRVSVYANGHRLWTRDAVVSSLTFSPNGRLVLGSGKTLRVWDSQTGKLMRSLPRSEHALELSHTPSGDLRIARWHTSSSQHLSVTLLNDDPRQSREFALARNPASYDWAPTGDAALVNCISALTVIESNGATHHLDGLTATGSRWAPDGSALLLLTQGGVHIWDRATKRLRFRQPAHPNVDEAATVGGTWRPDGQAFATWDTFFHPPTDDAPRHVHVWDATTGQALAHVHAHAAVTGVAWHPAGNAILTYGGYGAAFSMSSWVASDIRAWGLDGQEQARFQGHTAAFSPDGRYLAIGAGHPSRSENGTSTEVRTTSDSKVVATLEGLVVQWAADTSWVVTRVEPYSSTNAPAGPPRFHVWQLPNGEKLRTWAPFAEVVDGSVSFSSSSPTATILDETRIEQYESPSFEKVGTFTSSKDTIVGRWVRDGIAVEGTRLSEYETQLLRTDSGRALVIDTTVRRGRCDVSISEGEMFDGDPARWAVRTGNDLRTAKMATYHPLTRKLRRSGLLADFLQAPE